jgi:hypothetical protein
LKTRNLVLSLGMAGMLIAAGAANTANTANASSAPAAAASAAQDAKSFTHEAAGVTFNLPAGWTAEPDGDQLTVSPAGGGIGVVFWVTDEEDAAKALGEELAKQIKNLKFDGEPKADKHNGMDHASVSGTGQIGGEDILFSADFLEAKKSLIVLTFGSLEGLKKHSAGYSQLVKSIKLVD